METLGFEVTAGDDTGIQVEVAMRPGLQQIAGSNIFHGGVMMALADVAAALACVHALDPTGSSGEIPFSPLVQLNANMFRNTDRGKIIARARLLSRGRRMMVAETTISSEDGKTLAQVTSNHFVLAAG
jgi:uncharacterized protein (TIGR00369 family)